VIVLIVEHVEFISMRMTIKLTGDCIFESTQHMKDNNNVCSQMSYRLTILLKFQPNAAKHVRGG
jgi:hypothetical protein